ncbi:MAG: glycosyltransferase family 2 protein [Desulforegulaceae bacterium]|nr:glycosyltransferase family 2 protein [Desulforegulaceae bacterium]
MTKPLVSIITRTKNRPLTLKRLSDNLCEQVYKNFEWIIVNDCGETNEVDNIKNTAQGKGVCTKVIHNNIPKGRSFPVNLGANHSKGKYILILDDDDYLHKECLNEMVLFLERNNKFDAVAAKTQVVIEKIDQTGNISKVKNGYLYSPKNKDFRFENIFFANPTPVHGVLIKKNKFLSAGGFPTDIEYTEDWYFWFKFSLNFKIAAIDKTLAYYSQRQTKNNKYKNSAAYNEKGDKLHRTYELIWKKKVLKKLNEKQLRKIINNPSWKTIDYSKLDFKKSSSYYSMKNKDKIIRLIPDIIIKYLKKILLRLEKFSIYQKNINKLKKLFHISND